MAGILPVTKPSAWFNQPRGKCFIIINSPPVILSTEGFDTEGFRLHTPRPFSALA